MTAPDAVVFLVLGGIVLVSTAPFWGPVAVAVAAVAVWRRLRSTGRHRAPGTPVRTAARAAVRTLADTGPDPAAGNALTCADTYPDVSVDTGPDLSGHDDAGER